MVCSVVLKGYHHFRKQGKACIGCLACNMLITAVLIISGIVVFLLSFHDVRTPLVDDYNQKVKEWNEKNHLFVLPANTTISSSLIFSGNSSYSWNVRSGFERIEGVSYDEDDDLLDGSDFDQYVPLFYRAVLPVFPNVSSSTSSSSSSSASTRSSSSSSSLFQNDNANSVGIPFSVQLSFAVTISSEGATTEAEGGGGECLVMLNNITLQTDIRRRIFVYCQLEVIPAGMTEMDCVRDRCVRDHRGVFYPDAHKLNEESCEVPMVPSMFCARVNTTTWQIVGGCDYDDYSSLLIYDTYEDDYVSPSSAPSVSSASSLTSSSEVHPSSSYSRRVRISSLFSPSSSSSSSSSRSSPSLSQASSPSQQTVERAGTHIYLVSADDPLFYAYNITDGSLFFGLGADDRRSIGTVLFVIGAIFLLILVCGLYVMGVLSESSLLLSMSPRHVIQTHAHKDASQFDEIHVHSTQQSQQQQQHVHHSHHHHHHHHHDQTQQQQQQQQQQPKLEGKSYAPSSSLAASSSYSLSSSASSSLSSSSSSLGASATGSSPLQTKDKPKERVRGESLREEKAKEKQEKTA